MAEAAQGRVQEAVESVVQELERDSIRGMQVPPEPLCSQCPPVLPVPPHYRPLSPTRALCKLRGPTPSCKPCDPSKCVLCVQEFCPTVHALQPPLPCACSACKPCAP
uniref:Uncharacterized protein n=1 Tax=Pavo cristatus TaxID=9049 RepID=A0A8C9FWB8_PAVCR